MNQNYFDVQGTQYSYVQQNIPEIFMIKNGPIEADDERSVTKEWDILENPSEVSWFHNPIGFPARSSTVGFGSMFRSRFEATQAGHMPQPVEQ